MLVSRLRTYEEGGVLITLSGQEPHGSLFFYQSQGTQEVARVPHTFPRHIPGQSVPLHPFTLPASRGEKRYSDIEFNVVYRFWKSIY